MGWLENVIYKNQEIENERLELTDKNSLYYLSTNLTLRNCTVVGVEEPPGLDNSVPEGLPIQGAAVGL